MTDKDPQARFFYRCGRCEDLKPMIYGINYMTGMPMFAGFRELAGCPDPLCEECYTTLAEIRSKHLEVATEEVKADIEAFKAEHKPKLVTV